MSEANTQTLYLLRTGVTISKNGASAERGYLLARSVTYHTIERRGGYVTLPNGDFEIKMEYSPNNSDRKQFRIYEHGVTNSAGNTAALLIHLGKYPDQITGCIAPGKIIINDGVGQSATAMEELFTFCGGFAIGKTAELFVGDWSNWNRPLEEIIQLQKEGVL